MYNFFVSLNPLIQALTAGIFTFLMTVIGSSIVFFFKDVNRYFMNIMISLASGIMLAASFFSLLNPAIDISKQIGNNSWISIVIGVLFGSIVLSVFNRLFDKKYSNVDNKLSIKRCFLLMTSITIHNIPEGLVIGVSFGAVNSNYGISLISAITLTLGIALQNLPEGSAISIPMRRDGFSRFTSFVFGSLSAIVEPIFSVIGVLLIICVRNLLPFILSFAAGAMIFVTIIELIPESQNDTKKDQMALFTILGFSIMMLFEIIF